MVSPANRFIVRERAGARCEYCRAPEIVTGTTYHLEHIVPLSKGGTDQLNNLALSCIHCNSQKSNHLTGIDPETARELTLFHPRKDRWERHFRFNAQTLELIGTTAKSRATVARLQLNRRKQVEARELWIELGLYP